MDNNATRRGRAPSNEIGIYLGLRGSEGRSLGTTTIAGTPSGTNTEHTNPGNRQRRSSPLGQDECTPETNTPHRSPLLLSAARSELGESEDRMGERDGQSGRSTHEITPDEYYTEMEGTMDVSDLEIVQILQEIERRRDHEILD